MADVKVQNEFGLTEVYLDLGGWFAPLGATSGADEVVISRYGFPVAFAEVDTDQYAPVVATSTNAADKKVINEYGLIERYSDLGSGIYARVVATSAGGSPKKVVDPFGRFMRFADLGDGTHGLVVGGTVDGTIINRYGLVEAVDSAGDGLIAIGPAVRVVSVNTITTLSAPGDPVATLSIANPVDGETYTWSLTDNAGGAVTINASTGAVTVADASGVGLQTTFTARATGSPSTDTFDRVITTPVASLFALEIETGFAIEIESGHALEVA